MILKLFRGNQAAFLILIPLLALLLWTKSFIYPFEIPVLSDAMPLYDLADAVINSSRILSQICALLFLILTSLLLARINTKFILIPARTYLPAIIFLIISSSYPHLHYFHPLIPSVLLLLLAVNRMFGAYKKEGLCYHFFDASILISLASLFYARMGIFIMIIWIGLIYLRPFYWREWAMSLIGFALPYIFLISHKYFYGQDINLFMDLVKENFMRESALTYIEYPYYIFVGMLVILIFLASFKMMQINTGLKILVRQFSKVFFWLFLITAILAAFFIESAGLLTLAAIPAAYLISFYFFTARSRLGSEIIFILFVLAYISVQVLA